MGPEIWLTAIGSLGVAVAFAFAFEVTRRRPERSALAIAAGALAPFALAMLLLVPFTISGVLDPPARPLGAPAALAWWSPRVLVVLVGPFAWLALVAWLVRSRDRESSRDVPWRVPALAAIPFLLIGIVGLAQGIGA